VPSPPLATATSDARGRTLIRRAEIGSAVALVISVIALGVNLYQTRLQLTQSHAGVWPYLAIHTPYAYDTREDATFHWVVQNNGVGPAIVKSTRVTLDGRPMRRWYAVFDALLQGRQRFGSFLEPVNDQVIPSGAKINAVSVSGAAGANLLHDAEDRLDMAICYCSVYDDCWITSLHRHEAVASCGSAGDDEFHD
jgi:hypothetical protein